MNEIQKITWGVLMAVLLAVAAKPAAGDVVVLRQGLDGYTGTSDNGLYGYSSIQDWNSGITLLLSIGDASTDGTDRRRTILRFDVSSIPTNEILSATLKLTKEESSMQRSFTFGVYQIADANAGWIEGAKDFAGAATGESSWIRKAHPSTLWAGSSGLSTPGADYVATPVASNILYDVGDTNSITDQNGVGIDITLPVALINYWRTNTNAGLLLISDVEASGTTTYNQQFASSEHGTVAWRPTLTIVSVPEPPSAILGALGALSWLGFRLTRRTRSK